MSLSAHNARVGLVNKRPRSSLQATEPAATQTPRKSPSSHGNITGSAEPSPQSYFMSLRIWTSLFRFVSIVFHLFVLFFPLFSSFWPKAFWRVQRASLDGCGFYLAVWWERGVSCDQPAEAGKIKTNFCMAKKGPLCTSTITAACCCFSES